MSKKFKMAIAAYDAARGVARYGEIERARVANSIVIRMVGYASES